MSASMEIYISAATTTYSLVEPAQDLEVVLPWLAVTSGDVADQAWFWTPEWQAGEREADEEIAAGRTTYFGSDEEFLTALEREIG
jgi:hypothetical protein